jgi:hypothetical protein
MPAPLTLENSTSARRTATPASSAFAAVSPTVATSGSPKMMLGTATWSAVATCTPKGASSTGRPRARAAITSPAARPWYLPWWVKSARWFTSPTA